MTSPHTLADPARVADDARIATPCRDPRYDPNSWYPEGAGGRGAAAGRAARDLCAYRCPLQAMCRDYAIATGEKWGIWGGLTAANRATMRRGGRLRDVRARWLAGYTDHDGNPIDTSGVAATPAA